MMKWLIGLIVIIALAGCSQTIAEPVPIKPQANEQQEIYHSEAQPVEIFRDLEELATITPMVVMAKTLSDNIEFDYSDVTFFRTELRIDQVFRDVNDEIGKDNKITLLQNDLAELDPLVNQNEPVLLFLKKYEGPVIDNAYRIVGLVQGHFKFDGDRIKSLVAEQESIFYKNAEGFNVESLRHILKTNPYEPLLAEPNRMSEEEIKKQNQMEKELEKQHNNN